STGEPPPSTFNYAWDIADRECRRRNQKTSSHQRLLFFFGRVVCLFQRITRRHFIPRAVMIE
ncbi:hypothetical protein, partial [Burkholderia cenocepacia]|uniref:hypothetical protein n=1 Tax=Burkholderia cenocepacia TaxID=95486 RepID=UPI001C2EC470